MSPAGSVAPPGWPAAVPPPDHPAFPRRAVAWLLDAGPPELRTVSALTNRPVALARVVAHHVAASLDGLRRAYAGARRELGDLMAPDELADVLAALEREGARLVSLQREVDLVEEALRGTRWRPRL
jgi:hypothetical protein